MELRENEFYCDVQVLIPHDDVASAQRLLARLLISEARTKALQGQKVRVRCRLLEDGTIEVVS
jgi:hypothetical protein